MSQQLPKMAYDGGRILRHPGEPPSAAPASNPFPPPISYEQYYGLKEKPFSLSADPRFLYRSPQHAPAFEDLLHGIRRREGLIVLTGEIGTGKTTLIRSVLQNLDRRTFSAFVPDPFVSREDLLKMLLVDFGVVSVGDLKRGSLKGASRPDLSYPLYEFLDSLVPLQAFAVLIVDEAQNLPLPLLEEIRILSDLEGREKLLQVVLVGQPELRASLKLPQMRQVDQRVSVRCELAPLSRRDVGDYIRHRLNIASDGAARVEFTDDAMRAVHHGAAGTPRVINLICDRALHRGCLTHVERIDASLIALAIADLGLEPRADENEDDDFLTAADDPPIERLDDSVESAWTEPAERDEPADAPVAGHAQPAIAPRSELRADGGLPASLELWDTPVPPASARQREAVPALRPEEPAEIEKLEPPLSYQSGRGTVPAGWRMDPPTWWLNVGGACLALIGLVGGGLYWYAGALDVPLARVPAAPARWALPSLPVRSVPDGITTLASATKQTSAAGGATGRFSIEVAAFETSERADRLVTDLTRLGYAARSVTVVFDPPRPPLVQVLVGRYSSTVDAEEDLTTIRELFADARLERMGR